MASRWIGTLLHVVIWSSSQLVLLASAYQDNEQWARIALTSAYSIWLICGIVVVLMDLDNTLRQPRLVVVPPFLLYLILITYGQASVAAAIALVPTIINIWITIIMEWNRDNAEVAQISAQYGT